MLIRTDVHNIGDPFIINEADAYYMYATSFDVEGFKVWKSYDLHSWQCLGTCLDLRDSWCRKDYWAPEVVHIGNRYVMHYSSRDRNSGMLNIGAATADDPRGPFNDQGPLMEPGYPIIDGHVLMDNGKNYLYFSKDCSGNIKENGDHVSEICVIELNDDLLDIKGEPRVLFGPSEPYDMVRYKNIMWNEGPYVLKHNGRYYMTYSANFFASKDYCICLAIADDPLGPFMKADKPILQSKDEGLDFAGPGHNAFFIDKQGKLKMVFHIQTDEHHPSQNRKAVIVDVHLCDDFIEVDEQ